MAKRGGKRPGAGRPKGSRSSAQKLILAERAREYTETALRVLVEIAENVESASARVSAAQALLDRGHGRPWQAVPYEPPAPPVPGQQPAAPAQPAVEQDNVRVFDPEEIRRLYGGVGKK